MYAQDLIFKMIQELLKNNCGEYVQIYIIHPDGTSVIVDDIDVYYDNENGELVIELNPEEDN